MFETSDNSQNGDPGPSPTEAGPLHDTSLSDPDIQIDSISDALAELGPNSPSSTRPPFDRDTIHSLVASLAIHLSAAGIFIVMALSFASPRFTFSGGMGSGVSVLSIAPSDDTASALSHISDQPPAPTSTDPTLSRQTKQDSVHQLHQDATASLADAALVASAQVPPAHTLPPEVTTPTPSSDLIAIGPSHDLPPPLPDRTGGSAAGPQRTAVGDANQSQKNQPNGAAHAQPTAASPPPDIASSVVSADGTSSSSAAEMGGGPPSPDAGNRLPIYPLQAKRRGIEGTVILRLELRPDGRVKTVNVAESSGSDLLDRAAIDAARDWKFEMARAAPAQTGSELLLPVRFIIKA